ncbi:5' DNA nuclease [Rhizobium sp. 18065]|uniref:5' DNA nuclease n=1 Tax=Rhizobium sp. 18065 TaxID=2681411 RepID=UPI0013570839|nr:5' DNA nuclease [Rhizobium sp. 18065]
MVSGSDKTGEGKPVDPVDAARLAEALNPLMSNPAAAMAAATAIGFGLATHMTSLFLGSLQGVMDASGKLARKIEEDRKGSEVSAPQTPAEDTRAAPAQTVVKSEAKAKSAPVKAAKPVVVKRVVAKPAPAKPVAVKTPVAKVSAGEKPAPAPVAKPRVKASGKADDLKRIEGIGPKLEQVLIGKGISRLAQIAELGEEALSALDKDIGLDGRVLRDDWAGQARRLSGGKVRSGK